MNDRVALQAVFIAVMIDIDAERIGLYAKIAHSKSVKQKAKCIRVCQKGIGSQDNHDRS